MFLLALPLVVQDFYVSVNLTLQLSSNENETNTVCYSFQNHLFTNQKQVFLEAIGKNHTLFNGHIIRSSITKEFYGLLCDV